MLAFLDGRYPDALNAAAEAEPVLGAAMALPIEPTYPLFHALYAGALYPGAAAEQSSRRGRAFWRHGEEVRIVDQALSREFPPSSCAGLAELARIEGRDSEAMHHYEEAIRSAREHCFIQHQALAYELAARFHAQTVVVETSPIPIFSMHGPATNAGGQKARFVNWRVYTRSCEHDPSSHDSTIATSDEQLDLATVVNVSRAIFSGIDLNELIRTLMVLALEHAGAEPRLADPRASATPCVSKRKRRRRKTLSRSACRECLLPVHDLPESVLRYVVRTRDSPVAR